MGDFDLMAWSVGALAVVFLGLPALGFVGYWLWALLRFGWDLAAGL